jgi:hypothetical protein
MGMLGLLLSLLALVWSGKLKAARFWGWVALAALLWSLGENLPGLPYLLRLPGLNLLRVPSRALFIFGLATAALAAIAVQRLSEGLSHKERRRARLLLVGLLCLILTLSGGFLAIAQAQGGNNLIANFAWGAVFSLLGVIWLGLCLGGRIPWRIGYPVLLALCLLDWAGVDRSLFAFRPPTVVLSEGRELAEFLSVAPLPEQATAAASPVPFHLLPSYSLQQTAMFYGLELADGIDPLQLQSYVNLMDTATGVPSVGYSVTLPPFASGNPPVDNAAYVPDATRLALFNVRYVAAKFDLQAPGLLPRMKFGATRLYENMENLPRAWVQTDESLPPLARDRWRLSGTGKYQVQASGPGLLVLAGAYRWPAWVDGQPPRW